MKFEELLNLFSSLGSPHVCTDSRCVKKSDVFVAVKGYNVDGHDFIDKALANGVKYIVCQKLPQNHPSDVNFITVENSAKAAAVLAQAEKGNPASKLINLAVTGTNGKTTVAFLVQHIVRSANQRCGLIGTVVYDTGKEVKSSTMTTPDSCDLAQMMAEMVDAGSKYMVIEASSHSLEQSRLGAINFTAAAFTNLTGDHLDYHKTFENYLAAKTVLFKQLSSTATAILNKQSPASVEIAKQTKAKILWYAVDEPADITARVESHDTASTVFILEYADQKQKVRTSLIGTHNISNCLAAAGLCIAAGFDLKKIAKALSTFKTVPGRLEKVPFDNGYTVLVDYAHTDDALKNVLTTLRPLCKGRLIALFGCGGDRDKTKRPRMAKITEELADSIIVTSDNPRTEDPLAIINDIMIGFSKSSSDKITVEPDREKAIKFAIQNASKDDIILLAGKGHEDYQIIGRQKRHFSDKEIALKYLSELK